jgi:hypothetical protein
MNGNDCYLTWPFYYPFPSSDRPYDASKKCPRLELESKSKRNAVPDNFPRFDRFIPGRKCLSIYQSNKISLKMLSLSFVMVLTTVHVHHQLESRWVYSLAGLRIYSSL